MPLLLLLISCSACRSQPPHRSRSLSLRGRWSMVSGNARHWSRTLLHMMARESPADATHSLLPCW